MYKTATLTDRIALVRYANDRRDQARSAQLVDLCGGPEAIKVYEIEIKE